MLRFRDISIRHKLTILLVGSVSVVLLLSSVAISVSHVQTIRAQMTDSYSTLADVVATNSAAALSIAELDPAPTQDVIEDLAVDPAILFAAAYRADGDEVARQTTNKWNDFRPTDTTTPREVFTDEDYLDVVRKVTTADGTIVGHLYFRVATDEIATLMKRTLAIVSVIFVLALGLAFLLAVGSRLVFTRPIYHLAEVAMRVSTDHDYSLRATKQGNDELGQLCDGLNVMLGEIQFRDSELIKHRTQLENLVEERTGDLKSRTTDLAHSNAELARRNKELDEFAYVASHDLRSPLRAIDNLATWIAEDEDNAFSEQSRDDIGKLRGRVRRMELLLDGLLQYSRIGSKQYESVEIDIGEVLQEIAHLLDRPSEFQIEIADNMPTLLAPRVPLETVFRNLIDNAIKHHDRPDGKIEVSCREAGTMVEFSVSDDGPGIAPEYQEKVFQIFETIRTRDQVEGSGMGLALVRKTIELHGGTLTLTSTPDQGATFRFTWPKSA